MSDLPVTIGTEDGEAYVLTPEEIRLIVAAAGPLIDDIERRSGRVASGRLAELVARLRAVARENEEGGVRLDEPCPGRPRGWMTVGEVAEVMAVSTDAVTKACRQGRLPGAWRLDHRTWLVPATAIEERG